ncbi:ParB/RepB/Spo0J family partition protein [Azospirillum sp. BE72]|uniref:ParB/RepB/Spo0J family partition protein n=1 Tax=Azospirillum sp. BE72 TaxID=2817776 RepID=UPI0028596321|nr:ParB/RepB/Spo0J family partition protein [Azospirillum sp. BE72]MDR6772152.1 ParB family chromosome partitioning protein [Azospirillum sp. BE72]
MSRSLLGKAQKSAQSANSTAAARVKDALFGLSRHAPHLVEVPVDRIAPNPNQPRREFDEEELQGLAASIERHGLQQPIGVRQIADDRWQLVYGERRLRAMRLLGRETIFGILFTGDDDEEIAIVENLQRSDLNPLEESDALFRLAERHGYSHRQLADALGRKKTYVTMMLSFQRLAPAIRADYAALRPTKSKLEALAAIEDQDEQVRAWEKLKRSDAGAPPSPAVDLVSASPEMAAKRASVSAPAGVASSALPKRAAKPVFQARDVLKELQEKPQRLSETDRQALLEMRAAIDAVLEAATN